MKKVTKNATEVKRLERASVVQNGKNKNRVGNGSTVGQKVARTSTLSPRRVVQYGAAINPFFWAGDAVRDPSTRLHYYTPYLTGY